MPFVRKSSKESRDGGAKSLSKRIMILWPRERMARCAHATPKREPHQLPPDPSALASSLYQTMDIEETVVRGTHKAAGHGLYGHGELWAGQVAKLAGVASNRAVKSRRGAADRRPTKIDVLGNAIRKFPHLIRKIHGQERLGKQTGGIGPDWPTPR